MLEQLDGNGERLGFRVKVRFANDSEQVSFRGTPFTPALISREIWAIGGGVSLVYTSLPDTEAFETVKRERKTYDPSTTEVLDVQDGYLRETTCTSGSVRICVSETVETFDNAPTVSRTSASGVMRSVADEFELPSTGWTFDDVMFTHSTAGPTVSVNANGIGTIYRTADQAFSERAIYYRIDGVGERGSLAGTPFGPGGSAEGLFF